MTNSIQRQAQTDDPDALLEIVEAETDEFLEAWAHGDPVAAEMLDAYFIVRARLRFHRTVRLLNGIAAAATPARRVTARLIIEAARSAGRVHQDWSWAEKEVTAAFWQQAEDPW